MHLRNTHSGGTANLRAGYPIERIFKAYPTLPDGGIEAAIRWAESAGIDWRH